MTDTLLRLMWAAIGTFLEVTLIVLAFGLFFGVIPYLWASPIPTALLLWLATIVALAGLSTLLAAGWLAAAIWEVLFD